MAWRTETDAEVEGTPDSQAGAGARVEAGSGTGSGGPGAFLSSGIEVKVLWGHPLCRCALSPLLVCLKGEEELRPIGTQGEAWRSFLCSRPCGWHVFFRRLVGRACLHSAFPVAGLKLLQSRSMSYIIQHTEAPSFCSFFAGNLSSGHLAVQGLIIEDGAKRKGKNLFDSSVVLNKNL